MKTAQKPRKVRKNSTLVQRTSRKRAQPKSKPLLLDRLHLVEHRHSGKLLHRRHTSFLFLGLILVVVGVFIVASEGLANAAQQSISHSLTVNLTVPGPPPIVGAVITWPLTDTTTSDVKTSVSGTCESSSMVVIYDNGQPAGTTMCSSAGVFSLDVQLVDGINDLQALNYDSLNQAGPTTPTVRVTSMQPPVITLSGQTVYPVPDAPVKYNPASLPNPAVIPALAGTTKKSCDTYDGPQVVEGGTFKVTIVCFTRLLQPLVAFEVGILVQGGTAPYAVNINWGDSKLSESLISIDKPGYQVIRFAYRVPGQFVVKIYGTDKQGLSSYSQVIAQVNGQSASPTTGVINTLQKEILSPTWFEKPVPLYLIALTLTLGFWVGDIFDRRFGARDVRRQRRTRTA